MSTVHDHAPEALAKAPADADPTKSRTLRRRYAQRLRGQFIKLRAAINDGVGQRDVFGLTQPEALQPRDPRDLRDRTFRFTTDDQQVERFMDWLRRQERRGVLEVIGSGENQFVRSAYAKGVRHADAALNAEGLTIPGQELAAVFNTPVHQDALQMLFTRNFQELEGITEAMNQQISRELTDGFSRGLGPRSMARNITDRVEKVGMSRATTLARTEVINAHSTATLNRYEEFGTETVTIQSEFLTAGDSRVCPLCASLEGRTFTIEQARTETFDFSAGAAQPSSLSGTYPVNPPIHANCRCAWIPEVT